MTNKFGKISALREHMLDGHKVSHLESMVMFGASNLTATISAMKKWIFNKIQKSKYDTYS